MYNFHQIKKVFYVYETEVTIVVFGFDQIDQLETRELEILNHIFEF